MFLYAILLDELSCILQLVKLFLFSEFMKILKMLASFQYAVQQASSNTLFQNVVLKIIRREGNSLEYTQFARATWCLCRRTDGCGAAEEGLDGLYYLWLSWAVKPLIGGQITSSLSILCVGHPVDDVILSRQPLLLTSNSRRYCNEMVPTIRHLFEFLLSIGFHIFHAIFCISELYYSP